MDKIQAINTVPVELVVRDDIFWVTINRVKEATLHEYLCTSCLGKAIASGRVEHIQVIHSRVEYGKCMNCKAVTTNHACVTLGVIPQELNQLAATRQIHFVAARNTAYRIKRIPFSV